MGGWREVGVCAAACLRKRPGWGGKPILHQQRVNKKAAVYLCLKDKYPEWGRSGEEEEEGGGRVRRGGSAAPPLSAATSPWLLSTRPAPAVLRQVQRPCEPFSSADGANS